MPHDNPHIALLIGSAREHSRTAKAVRYVASRLKDAHEVSVDVLDPRDFVVQFPGQEAADDFAAAITPRIAKADAVLMGTPEYHGSYSAVLKAFIDSLGYPSALEGKPVALIGVAAGRMGAAKSLEHLSGVCLHIGSVVLPGAVSIAKAYTVFDASGIVVDAAVRVELDHLAMLLAEAARGHLMVDNTMEHSTRN